MLFDAEQTLLAQGARARASQKPQCECLSQRSNCFQDKGVHRDRHRNRRWFDLWQLFSTEPMLDDDDSDLAE